jgi:hypothetical protein
MAKLIPTTLALLVLATTGAHADTLLLDGIDLDKPGRVGRNRHVDDGVESSYGAPAQRHAPVGGANAQQPPITRWDYPSFSVYFEHDRVIHAVARHQ